MHTFTYGYAGDMGSLFICAYLAILFLQAGLDKVINYRSNLEYIQGYFSKSPLAKGAVLMFPMLTACEVVTGVLCATSCVGIACGIPVLDWAIWSYAAASITLLMLFFGNRMAKDYAASASLTPYLCMVALGYLIEMAGQIINQQRVPF